MVKRKTTPQKVPPRGSEPPMKPMRKKPKEHIPYNIGNKVFKLNKSTLQHIRKLQSTTKLCIPKLPFSKLIREILREYTTPDMKIQKEALTALHEAAEMYIIQLFEDSNRCAGHAKRVTLKPIDIKLALAIRGMQDPGFVFR